MRHRTGSTAVRRATSLVGAIALTLALATPALASAPRTKWVCLVPEDGHYTRVVFVSAAAAARHGIDVANATAGETFSTRFGEICTVH